MRSKNIIEKIGNIIFTHGGLSNRLLNKDLNLDYINEIAKRSYGLDLANNTNTIPNLLFGSYGPLWYRGLVKDSGDYFKVSMQDVDNFLEYYAADRIVIGHCIVNDISTDFEGKVVRIDQEHPENSYSDLDSKALLIENGVLYKVIQTGVKTQL